MVRSLTEPPSKLPKPKPNKYEATIIVTERTSEPEIKYKAKINGVAPKFLWESVSVVLAINSRKYYLEIEADGDAQSDYFLVYQPKGEDLGLNWKNKGGTGEVEVYKDSNNSIGGGNRTGVDNTDSDGYESDLSSGKNLSSGDFYVRLVNGNVQMALKKSKIGSPSNILSRAYASQNTNLAPNKLTWHDHNTISDFSGSGGFDSTAGADTSTWLKYSTPTPNPSSEPIIFAD